MWRVLGAPPMPTAQRSEWLQWVRGVYLRLGLPSLPVLVAVGVVIGFPTWFVVVGVVLATLTGAGYLNLIAILRRAQAREAAEDQLVSNTTDPSPSPAGGAAWLVVRRDAARAAQAVAYRVVVDGTQVGKLANGECARFKVASGRRKVHFEIDGGRSVPLEFTVAAGQEAEVHCWTNATLLTGLYWATLGRSRFIGSELAAQTAEQS